MTDENRQEPTVELIRELYEHNTTYWSKQISDDARDIALYYDEEPVQVPDTQSKKRRRRVKAERMSSSEAARCTDLVSSLFPHPATIGLQYTGTGNRSEQTADDLSIGLNEAIDQLNPALDSPLKRGRWSMVLLGRQADMIVPGSAYWYDFPEMGAGETLDAWYERYNAWKYGGPVPLVWADLPAESTFPASFGRMEDELLTWMSVTYDELAVMFGKDALKLREEREKKRSDVATLGIYSNCHWLSYAVLGNTDKEDSLLRSIRHGMTKPVIRIAPGVTSGRKEPGRFWLGILHHVRKLLDQADRRLSEAATASKFDAFPLLKSWMQDQDLLGEGAQQDDAAYLEGDIIPLRPGQVDGTDKEDIEAVFQPRFGDKTLALAQFALGRIERITGAVEALEGAFGPAGQPAWSRNFSVEQAKAKHAMLIDGVVAADLDAAERIIDAVVAFGEDVRLRARSPGAPGPEIILKPDVVKDYKPILKGDYTIKVPVNKRADYDLMVSIMERAQKSGLPISPAWAMETLGGIEQPFEMFKETIVWSWLQSEPVRNFYLQQLTKDAEVDLSADNGISQQELGQMIANGRIDPNVGKQLLALSQGPGAGLPPGGAPPTAGGGGVNPQTQGAVRAGAPFSSGPGGPTPQEATPLP